MKMEVEPQTQSDESTWQLPRLMVRMLAWLVSLLIPVLLVLVSVRLVMTTTYLRLEYKRPGFPPDLYGWEQDVRLEYGPYGVKYLLTDADISTLGDVVIDDEAAFTERELMHMQDVKTVTQGAMRVLTFSLIAFIVSAGLLAYRPQTRPALLRAISQGGFSTLGLIAGLIVVVLVSWDFYFDSFHGLFFESGSWQFYRSDTLIRLYPQQFWFDTSLVVGVLTIGGALLCAFVPRWALRRRDAAVNQASHQN